MHLLHQPQGGKGRLLGGLAGVERGRVVIIGAGTAGGNAAATRGRHRGRGHGVRYQPDRLAAMRELGNNVTGLYPYPEASVRTCGEQTDVVIGAALSAGPVHHTSSLGDMVASMQPGSVVIDISVDQGGCIETTRPTNYDDPTYVEEGVMHFCVTNMPGAVPHERHPGTFRRIAALCLATGTSGLGEFPDLTAGHQYPGWRANSPGTASNT